jgi:hypothetical protein
VSSKPLNAAGAAPPESEFSFHHWAPHNVTEVPAEEAIGPTVRSPTTNMPPGVIAAAGMCSEAVAFGASFELTVAVLSTAPARSSAAVTVCCPLHVIDAPTARVVPGQLGAASTLLSDSEIPLSELVPVFVTR